VIVDDYFLHDKDNNSHFARFKNGKIWVSLLEKAWAKTCGSYDRIACGHDVDVFGTYSGLPAKSFYHCDHNTDEVFDWIFQCDSKDYAIHGSTKPEPANKRERMNGIFYGHAYSIIQVYRVDVGGK